MGAAVICGFKAQTNGTNFKTTEASTRQQKGESLKNALLLFFLFNSISIIKDNTLRLLTAWQMWTWVPYIIYTYVCNNKAH